MGLLGSIVTVRTLVALFSVVRFRVLFEEICLGVSFGATFAPEGKIRSVYVSYVSSEIGMVFETLTTHVAYGSLLIQAVFFVPVRPQRILEPIHFATDVTTVSKSEFLAFFFRSPLDRGSILLIRLCFVMDLIVVLK